MTGSTWISKQLPNTRIIQIISVSVKLEFDAVTGNQWTSQQSLDKRKNVDQHLDEFFP